MVTQRCDTAHGHAKMSTSCATSGGVWVDTHTHTHTTHTQCQATTHTHTHTPVHHCTTPGGVVVAWRASLAGSVTWGGWGVGKRNSPHTQREEQTRHTGTRHSMGVRLGPAAPKFGPSITPPIYTCFCCLEGTTAADPRMTHRFNKFRTWWKQQLQQSRPFPLKVTKCIMFFQRGARRPLGFDHAPTYTASPLAVRGSATVCQTGSGSGSGSGNDVCAHAGAMAPHAHTHTPHAATHYIHTRGDHYTYMRRPLHTRGVAPHHQYYHNTVVGTGTCT